MLRAVAALLDGALDPHATPELPPGFWTLSESVLELFEVVELESTPHAVAFAALGASVGEFYERHGCVAPRRVLTLVRQIGENALIEGDARWDADRATLLVWHPRYCSQRCMRRTPRRADPEGAAGQAMQPDELRHLAAVTTRVLRRCVEEAAKEQARGPRVYTTQSLYAGRLAQHTHTSTVDGSDATWLAYWPCLASTLIDASLGKLAIESGLLMECVRAVRQVRPVGSERRSGSEYDPYLAMLIIGVAHMMTDAEMAEAVEGGLLEALAQSTTAGTTIRLELLDPESGVSMLSSRRE